MKGPAKNPSGVAKVNGSGGPRTFGQGNHTKQDREHMKSQLTDEKTVGILEPIDATGNLTCGDPGRALQGVPRQATIFRTTRRF